MKLKLVSKSPLDAALQLLESQKKITTSLLQNAHREHIIGVEQEIARYSADLLALIESNKTRIVGAANDYGALGVILNDFTAKMQALAREYIPVACDDGWARGLHDLKIRKWLNHIIGNPVAPASVSDAILSANQNYLQRSLLPAMHQKIFSSDTPDAALVSFSARIQTYAHYLWRAAESSYRACMREYFAALAQPKSLREGGEGSGNYGHGGRPGEIGGSIPRGMTKASDILRKVAVIHDRAVNQPEDPATKTAYQTFKDQVLQQYNDLTNQGYRFNFTSNDPYTTSKEMIHDVTADHTLTVYNQADLPPGHPLADIAPNGQTYNSVFRGVHDIYGHALQGNQFGPKGELAAYQAHSKMFTDEALPALAAETLAQNAWVNFGPNHPEMLLPQDRPFAEQKAYAFPIDIAKPIANGDVPTRMRESMKIVNDLDDTDYRRPRDHKLREGSASSGNFGHAGRPGMRGGSMRSSGNPQAVFIVGGAGSGKGSIARSYERRGYIRIDPDEEKTEVPIYSKKYGIDPEGNLKPGMYGPSGPRTMEEFMKYPSDERAAVENYLKTHTQYETLRDFANNELPEHNLDQQGTNFAGGLTHEMSSFIARQKVGELINNGDKSFVYDAVGGPRYKVFADDALQNNMDVTFHRAVVPRELAYFRNDQRARTVSPEVVGGTHDKVAMLEPQLKDYTDQRSSEGYNVTYMRTRTYSSEQSALARSLGYTKNGPPRANEAS